MVTETLPAEFARLLEFSELNAWSDMWEAIPADVARQFGMTKRNVGDVLVLTCAGFPFFLFNRVMGLGLSHPATKSEVEQIVKIFRAENINNNLVHHIPHTRTAFRHLLRTASSNYSIQGKHCIPIF
jgi:hypothetical protein